MDLAIKLSPNDRIRRIEAIPAIRDHESQSLLTQGRRRGELVAMLPAIKKKIYYTGDEIMEFDNGNIFLKNKIADYDDQKGLTESELKPF